jgi:hypothetical protein
VTSTVSLEASSPSEEVTDMNLSHSSFPRP